MSSQNVKSICEKCGTVGFPAKKAAGASWVEILLYIVAIVFVPMTLFLSLIVPIAYSISRHTAAERVCYKCGGNMIPLNTPMGKKLLKEIGEEPMTEAYQPMPIINIPNKTKPKKPSGFSYEP